MSRFRKIIFFVISAILVLTLLSSVYRTAENEVEATQHFTGEEISSSAKLVGYSSELDPKTGKTVYKSLLDISHILLPHDGTNYNTVVVRLSAPPHTDEKVENENGELEEARLREPELYYNFDESGFYVFDNFCNATEINEGETYVFRSYHSDDKNAIGINIDGEFSIEEVSVYMVDGDAVYTKVNFIALGVFAATLAFALVFERKLGYFAWVIGSVRKELDYTFNLKPRKRAFVLHLSAVLSTALLVGICAYTVIFSAYSRLLVVLIFALSAIALALQLVDRICSGRGAAAAKLFLVVALIFGVMMCVTSPTTTHCAWDDEIHLLKTHLNATPFNDTENYAEAKLFTHNYRLADFISNPERFTDTLVAESEVPVDYSFDTGNAYTLISYAPMMAVVFLLSLIGADIVKNLVLCRLAMLLATTFITYFGIKKLKSGAYIFSAVCLLPCILYLCCSFAYDCWLTAWFVYAFAYIISVYQDADRRFTTSDMVKILLAFFLACSAKAIYCLSILPLLFISKKKFEKPSRAKLYKLLTVATVLVIAAILVLPGIFSHNMYADSRGGDNVDTLGQVLYILQHPLSFVRLLLDHLGEYCSLSRFNTYATAFGYLDGYDGNPELIFGTLSLALIAFSLFLDRKDDEDTLEIRPMRWITLGTVFAQIALISVSMYLAFNNVGADVINGCQFRYVFPLLAPFFFFIRPKGFKCLRSERFTSAFIFGGSSAILIFGYLCAYIDRIIIG